MSNFSAFQVYHRGIDFPTSEHAYHYEKFTHSDFVLHIAAEILKARSAHDAFKIAEKYRAQRDPNWDRDKVDIMRVILAEKCDQHEYVRRKLLQTGNRELVENSWRSASLACFCDASSRIVQWPTGRERMLQHLHNVV